MRIIFIIIFLLFFTETYCQNNTGLGWVIGEYGEFLTFKNDTSKPIISRIQPTWPSFLNSIIVNKGHTCINDSANGNLMFMASDMQIRDRNGAIMLNGDTLIHSSYYSFNAYPIGIPNQGSIALPKGSNGEYYVFSSTMSDSLYNLQYNIGTGRYIYDEVLYAVVDMKLNNGLGAVTSKRNYLIKNAELNRTQLFACRHANGYDWWLIKQAIDSAVFYKFLIKADTIEGPFIQHDLYDKLISHETGQGQLAFNSNGTQMASINSWRVNPFSFCDSAKLVLTDFNRCSGLFSNLKVINMPRGWSRVALHNNNCSDSLGDNSAMGVCFSPNNRFIYTLSGHHLYQFDTQEPNQSLQWLEIANALQDTSMWFSDWGTLNLGPDGRIYIGNWGGSAYTMSCITKPNLKGAACSFIDTFITSTHPYWSYPNNYATLNAPPNMANYNMGALPSACWPSSTTQLNYQTTELYIYPNPSNSKVIIDIGELNKNNICITNTAGQVLYNQLPKTAKISIDVSKWASGVYFVRYGNIVKMLAVE
ncbi:MAG: hypothetical protein RLZZ118_2116 [Bacteroidota bacterium]|jgi:hypothetical protein